MCEYIMSYEIVIKKSKASGLPMVEYLRQELPYVWRDSYFDMTPRSTNIVLFTHGTFDYIYDDYATLEATEVVKPDQITESRLVAAVGLSHPNQARRDDSRLRGWVGPTGETFGCGWDKGHFIAHSIGGAVDGLEANVFLQLRSVNRGEYRKMEKYCLTHPGVLCFSRPIYDDPSAKPARVEFGVLKPHGELWVQVFNNRDSRCE